MPYNPQITDQRGQMWANALGNTGASLGADIRQGVQQYQQNKLMASQAIGKFEAVVQADPSIMQFLQSPEAPPDIAKAFQKLGKDGAVPLKDAAMLSQFADTYSTQKQMTQDRQDQQRAQQRAQMLAQFTSGNGNSMLTNSAKTQMAQEVQNPAAQFAAQSYQYTGKAPSPEAFARFADTQVQAGARPKSPVLDLQKYRSTGADGKPIEIAVDQLTGKEVGRGPINEVKMINTPQEIAEAAGLSETAKKDAEAASVFVSTIPDAAEKAQAALSTVNEVERLYANGAKSGIGQDFINRGTAIGLRLGLIQPGQQANQEQLDKMMASSALQVGKELMAGTGQVSNYERELVNKASAELGKSAQANLRIVRYTKALAQRSIDLETKRQELVDQGKPTPSIAETLRRWRTSNPLTDYVERARKEHDKPATEPAQLVKGMVYEDANGNKATWDGQKYVPL